MPIGSDKPRDRVPGAPRPGAATPPARAAQPPAAEPTPPLGRPSLGTAVGRGIALFMGIFTLLNLAIEVRRPGYDANLWWISLYPLPRIVAQAAMLLLAVLWIAFAVAPEMQPVRRRMTRTAIELLWLFVGWNILNFYALLLRHRITTTLPVPVSIVVAVLLWGIWRSALSERPALGPGAWAIMFVTVLAGGIVFPLLLMVCFGLTDYRRHADVAVVFGARVYANGSPSDAVRDRVNTAVGLYKKKLVSKLIFSGGPADGGKLSEADVMRRLAVDAGVSYPDTSVDPLGVNTDATVQNAGVKLQTLSESMNLDRKPVVIAVSHFYHLPRIKMRFGEEGIDVLTVPVREPLAGTAKFMVREVGAMWKYYLEALLG
jgi:vancomycin permeability regulator SanA